MRRQYHVVPLDPRSAPAMLRRSTLLLCALLLGGWMTFDGIHVLTSGKYFGPDKPGPWADVVAAVGIDPFSVGPLFVVLGLAWLVVLGLMLARHRASGAVTTGIAVATLWYLPVGTVLAIVVLVVLRFSRRAES